MTMGVSTIPKSEPTAGTTLTVISVGSTLIITFLLNAFGPAAVGLVLVTLPFSASLALLMDGALEIGVVGGTFSVGVVC